MHSFYMNGYLWRICYVDPDDDALIDITGKRSVATTDWDTKTVSISRYLYGEFKARVIIHELGHCAMFSFGLIDQIHDMTYPDQWIDVEEWVCNFIADYGKIIFSIGSKILGDMAWMLIPEELEKVLA